MQNFSLMILCAGFGTRMLDLTHRIPKPLLKINKTTLLSNTITFFKKLGCDEILINTHYLHKEIENYIKKNYDNAFVKLIYEPTILGTGGGIKNIFNYKDKTKIITTNSDIYWKKNNVSEVLLFVKNLEDVNYCKILLSPDESFIGLKKEVGDFSLSKNVITRWKKSERKLFFSGLQIVSSNIFEKNKNKFSMNEVWDELILQKKLKGEIMQSKIFHIGDKKSFLEV